jgi:RNA polymerase sigma-70 factor, ECF subfamily
MINKDDIPLSNQDGSILLDLIKAGNINAFENLFNSHYSALCIYASKVLGDMDEARDIVQNVFVTFYVNRNAIEVTSSLRSYLYKSVYHACLNHLKKVKLHRRHHEHLKYQLPFSDDHDALVNSELEEKIWGVVQRLPEQCRRIFEMNRFEGRKNREIAVTLGISIRTVETQISKALKILRENLITFLVSLLLLSITA